jgi:hypothetical protein
MNAEEDIQQITVRDDIIIECDPHHLRVTSPAGADFLVARIIHVPACVSGFNRFHTFDLIVDGLQTPKTPPG